MNDRISMKHGAGGRAMRRLIETVFAREAETLPDGGVGLGAMDDGAAFRLGERWLVVTTDSHVIQPIFFAGGDIGRLAVSGTLNDLAMMGATEILGLSCSVIIEEGFAQADLERLAQSMRETCRAVEAPIVTGDTKVMGAGELDGIVINTTGLGLTDRVVRDAGLTPGCKILVTGTVGDHGLAILAQRKGIAFAGALRSDVAPLTGLIRRALYAGGQDIVAMKDPTRGGVASALQEMASKAGVGIVIDETAIPLTDEVRAAAEVLGIDPLHVANEGKALLGVQPDAAATVLEALRSHPLGRRAQVIGTVSAAHRGQVILDTGFGRRLVTEPEGELLPRIC